ncbi:MAG: efflux transporter outer membrane subunit [Planctomycetota bacterium]|jgi:NodT family efflux transporter outer membrane factor (OMF) lipoprotein
MNKLFLVFLVLTIIVMSGGCSHTVKNPAMPAEIPKSFSTTGTEPLDSSFWQVFEDGKLDSLIGRALANNFNLETAWDRLAQAQAVAKKSEAALWPQAELDAGFRRSRQESQGLTTYNSLYSLGVAAGYEVDLWSRLRSSQKAAWLDVQAQREAVNTAAITLTASITNTWYQLAEVKALIRIAAEQIQANRQVLEIVTVKFRKGSASAPDVLRQRQLVASTEALLIVAEEAEELLQYQLSVLIGNRPELIWQQTTIALPDLPPLPNLGVPAEVLWRRPDVRQDFRRLQAADQRLAAAVADQYPRISIAASAETSAVSAHDLFDDWLANLAANAVQPLFDADRRKAEVQRQQAVVTERVHIWGQTILDALLDIEAALTQERQQTQLIESLDLQLELARETYQRNRERYVKGQTNYIRVLESLQSLQTLERNVVTAQRLLIGYRIDLYRSIAGPFDLPEPAISRTQSTTETVSNSAIIIGDE